jgi:hypothetical protein
MKEADYIIATNRVKASAALNLVRDMLPGDDYGVGEYQLSQIHDMLRLLEIRLFDATPELIE